MRRWRVLGAELARCSQHRPAAGAQALSSSLRREDDGRWAHAAAVWLRRLACWRVGVRPHRRRRPAGAPAESASYARRRQHEVAARTDDAGTSATCELPGAGGPSTMTARRRPDLRLTILSRHALMVNGRCLQHEPARRRRVDAATGERGWRTSVADGAGRPRQRHARLESIAAGPTGGFLVSGEPRGVDPFPAGLSGIRRGRQVNCARRAAPRIPLDRRAVVCRERSRRHARGDQPMHKRRRRVVRWFDAVTGAPEVAVQPGAAAGGQTRDWAAIGGIQRRGQRLSDERR